MVLGSWYTDGGAFDPRPHLRLTLKLLSAPGPPAAGAARKTRWCRGAGATAYAERAPRQAREIKRLLGHATHDIAEQHYIYAQAINASRRHVAMMEELRSQAMDEEGYSFQHRPEISQLSSSMACDICLVIAPEPDPA